MVLKSVGRHETNVIYSITVHYRSLSIKVLHIAHTREPGTHCTGTLLSHNPIHNISLNVSNHLLILKNDYYSTDRYNTSFLTNPLLYFKKGSMYFQAFPFTESQLSSM